MEIAIIFSEGRTENRATHKIALELADRLLGFGEEPRMFDLADAPIHLQDPRQWSGKAVFLVGESTDAIYPLSFHYLLSEGPEQWKDVPVVTIMCSDSIETASKANHQLQNVLKVLDARVLESELSLNDVHNKFDHTLSLLDLDLQRTLDNVIQKMLFQAYNSGSDQKIGKAFLTI